MAIVYFMFELIVFISLIMFINYLFGVNIVSYFKTKSNSKKTSFDILSEKKDELVVLKAKKGNIEEIMQIEKEILSLEKGIAKTKKALKRIN